MHCTKKHGGFGDPHCAEPYGVEAQSPVRSLLAYFDNDTGLAFDNFSDHCPELRKQRLQTILWIRKLPFVSVLGPSGLLALGDVPKTSPLNDRRVTLLVAMPSPTRSLIARGMLSSAKASKMRANVGTKGTGGMLFLHYAARRRCKYHTAPRALCTRKHFLACGSRT